MKIKEAITRLILITDIGVGINAEPNKEAIQMAVSALEKQIPKKPLQACGHATELFKKDISLMNYCPICGQKIDWCK